MDSWAQCLRGWVFSCSRGNYIAKLFLIFFLVFWNSINLAYVLQLGNKNLVSDHIFTSQRESHSVPDMGFLLAFNYFVPFGVIENIFTKINGWSLKKMVVLSVNFTILILWSPVSFNPFISINENGKYHSHNIV